MGIAGAIKMSGFFAHGLRRLFTRVGFLFGIALALVAMMSPQQAQATTTTISDANFLGSDWTLSKAIVVGVPTSPCVQSPFKYSQNNVIVSQILSGGST